MFFKQNEKNFKSVKIGFGKKVKIAETNVYFMLFKENQLNKWCHVMLDKIENNSLTVRTAPNAVPLVLKCENILLIGGSEIEKRLSQDDIKALFRGEIIGEKRK